MASSDVEYVLGNLAFACLLAMVIWYWVKTVFSLPTSLRFVGTFGIAAANLSLVGVLVSRWLVSGHFPLSNLYESLLFLSWGFTAFHLILERISRADFVGIVTSPIALLTNAFASFSLPPEMQKTTALIPALQSNWLMMHVSIMMISYVALISGSLLSIALLVINYYDKRRKKPVPLGPDSLLQSAKKTERLAITRPLGEGDPGVLSLVPLVSLGAQTYTSEAKPGIEGLRSTSSVAFSQGTGLRAELAVPARNAGEGRQGGSIGPSPMREGDRGDGHGISLPGGQESLRSFDSLSSEAPVIPWKESPSASSASTLSTFSQLAESGFATDSYLDEFADLSPFAQALDNLSYRTLGLGFPLLTIGILSGAVWANEAWGSYWSWDPKETWAFITWLVFAIYLHTRLSKGWRGDRPAAIAAVGFFVVWVCYLGVNLLGTGLHSYGWLQGRG